MAKVRRIELLFVVLETTVLPLYQTLITWILAPPMLISLYTLNPYTFPLAKDIGFKPMVCFYIQKVSNLPH